MPSLTARDLSTDFCSHSRGVLQTNMIYTPIWNLRTMYIHTSISPKWVRRIFRHCVLASDVHSERFRRAFVQSMCARGMDPRGNVIIYIWQRRQIIRACRHRRGFNTKLMNVFFVSLETRRHNVTVRRNNSVNPPFFGVGEFQCSFYIPAYMERDWCTIYIQEMSLKCTCATSAVSIPSVDIVYT